MDRFTKPETNEIIQGMIEYGILDIVLNNSLDFSHNILEVNFSLMSVFFILKTLKSKDDLNNRKLILNKISEFDYVSKITKK